MKEILYDTLIDTIKLIPFLLIAFLILEYIEHKMNNKNRQILINQQKYGPIIGSILGAFPQCGFGVMATNLFNGRVITIGTLISIYLSTSDEMLPLLISRGTAWQEIILIVLLKVVIGLFFGTLIDFFYRKSYRSKDVKKEIGIFCHDDNCHCEDGIIKSTIKHTINIYFFIFLATLLIGIAINYIGEDKISIILQQGNIISYLLSSLIGLIPNCASSVIITELYLNEMISLGNMLSGLLTGSGLGILVLFKTNKNLKENLWILFLIFIIGILSGFLIDLLGISL